MVARRFHVRGRVQGVGFRWFVIQAAGGRGLAGWTRNLPDGRVEVVAQGSPDDLDALAGDLSRGPRSARVEQVESADEPLDPNLKDFSVRY